MDEGMFPAPSTESGADEDLYATQAAFDADLLPNETLCVPSLQRRRRAHPVLIDRRLGYRLGVPCPSLPDAASLRLHRPPAAVLRRRQAPGHTLAR